LDLYLPKNPDQKPLPLIVWVHGGAWRAGSKNNPRAKGFTNQGYAVASINYRLSQEAKYPAQIHDCKAAIRWLKANAKKYNLDPNRIGAWGASAGGHLVALLGTTGEVKELEGDLGNLQYSSRVQAVCDWYGPTDFLQGDAHALPNSRFKHSAPDSPWSQLIGAPIIQENKDKIALANPINFISSDDPPFLIVHGDMDNTVPYHQSVIFYEALKKAGVDVIFHTAKGSGHGFKGRNAQIVSKLVHEFFDKHLKNRSNN
jgi:acetyl esterase/lipase